MIKQLPFSNSSEALILGTLLYNPDLLQQVTDILSVEDFYSSKHQQIFAALINLAKDKKPFSEEQILAELSKHVTSVDIVDLIGLQADFTDKEGLERHLALVKACSTKRALIHQATALLRILYDEQDHEKLIEQAQKAIYAMTGSKQTTAQPVKATIENALRYLSDNLKTGSLIKTHISELDYIIRGFEPGQFIVLAARPSMGKTALGLCIARNIVKQNIPVGFFSIEMTNEQMALRALALESDISMEELYSGLLFKDVNQFNELCESATMLSNYPFWLDDISKTMTEIRSQARKWVLDQKVKIIIVDYLGLIRPTRYRENRNVEIAEISEGLKSLAKELRIPILVLSQLSRGVEGRMDNRPKLSDLRDSGAIEQDADIVMFLYREHYYNHEADVHAAELLISKNRNGKTGIARLYFEPTTMKFE